MYMCLQKFRLGKQPHNEHSHGHSTNIRDTNRGAHNSSAFLINQNHSIYWLICDNECLI